MPDPSKIRPASYDTPLERAAALARAVDGLLAIFELATKHPTPEQRRAIAEWRAERRSLLQGDPGEPDPGNPHDHQQLTNQF